MLRDSLLEAVRVCRTSAPWLANDDFRNHLRQTFFTWKWIVWVVIIKCRFIRVAHLSLDAEIPANIYWIQKANRHKWAGWPLGFKFLKACLETPLRGCASRRRALHDLQTTTFGIICDRKLSCEKWIVWVELLVAEYSSVTAMSHLIVDSRWNITISESITVKFVTISNDYYTAPLAQLDRASVF